MALRMKTHTDYDFRHIEQLQRVVSRTVNPRVVRRTRISNAALGLCLLLMAAVVVACWKNYVLMGIFGVLGLFNVARGIFYYQFTAFGVRQGMDRSVTGSDYILEKSGLLVTNVKGGHRYPYADCFKLLETEDNLFFIMESGQGLILDKGNLKGGSVDELRAWMEEKCGQKAEFIPLSRHK